MKKLLCAVTVLFFGLSTFAQTADTVRKDHAGDGVFDANALLKPTYVVDGKVYRGNLSTLNVNDIKSITVLKNPDASKQYGTFNPNGVIVVETGKLLHNFVKPQSAVANTSASVRDSAVYVVDGVVSDKNMGGIRPEDIESIRVMRDGTTAEIYGAKNGVIFVTTKLGAARIYKQELSAVSSAYKKYLEEHNNDDSSLNYSVDGIVCDKGQDGLSRLSNLTKNKIAKVKFSKSEGSVSIITKK